MLDIDTSTAVDKIEKDPNEFIATRRSLVRSSGNKNAKGIVVNSAPNNMDLRSNQPMCGPPGSVFDACLAGARLSRADLYITHAIKDIDYPLLHQFHVKAGKVIRYSEDCINYAEYLKYELSGTDATTILAIGDLAWYMLTDRLSVHKWRGSVVPSTLIEGKKVMACIDPSTVTPYGGNQFLNNYLITWDLRRYAKHLETSEFLMPEAELITAPTFSMAMDVLIEFEKICLERGNVLDWDIEANDVYVTCISFAVDMYRSISIPFVSSKGHWFSLEEEYLIICQIAKMLYNPKITKRGQNNGFDQDYMFKKYGMITNTFEDCLLKQNLIFPDLPKGLDFLCSVYTEIPYYKDDGKKFFKSGIGGYDMLWTYSAMDSIATASAAKLQDEQFSIIGNDEAYERMLKLQRPLNYMQARGIRVDVNKMITMRDAFAKQFDELQLELNKVAGKELNPNSPKQMKEFFYGVTGEGGCGLKPYTNRTKGGKSTVTTNDMALKRIVRKGGKAGNAAKIVQGMRKLKKLRGTYLDQGKVDVDSRIRCSFNGAGTKYGRLSSSENVFGSGMNMQNWPSGMKVILRADHGMIYYSYDLSQFENRCVAYIGKIPAMIRAFEKREDVHSLTASMIFDKPVNEVSREKGSSNLGDGLHSERDWGKKANHGLNYNQSYRTFSLQNEIPENEGKFVVDTYHARYPELRRIFHADVERQLRKNRILTNLMGRKVRILGDLRNQMVLNEAYSCVPQGTCGDKMNEHGLIYIYKGMEDGYLDKVELLDQVHDSVDFQVPLSLPWTTHAKYLLMIKESLETPLYTHEGVKFVVPAELSMGLSFAPKHHEEIGYKEFPEDIDSLAIKLEENYELCQQKFTNGLMTNRYWRG